MNGCKLNVGRVACVTAMGVTLMFVGGASGGMVNATITADNHYALYADGPNGIVRIGGNEIGAGGSPGSYNWSLPESWTFETIGRLYIAVWSDDAVAQGLLADIRLPSGETLHTGDARWRVYITGLSRVDGSPWPEASEIAGYVSTADGGELWESPFICGVNDGSVSPWGQINGVASEVRWTWGNAGRRDNPLMGGNAVDNYQIFSIPVPTPAGGVALGAAALAVVLRRRRV